MYAKKPRGLTCGSEGNTVGVVNMELPSQSVSVDEQRQAFRVEIDRVLEHKKKLALSLKERNIYLKKLNLDRKQHNLDQEKQNLAHSLQLQNLDMEIDNHALEDQRQALMQQTLALTQQNLAMKQQTRALSLKKQNLALKQQNHDRARALNPDGQQSVVTKWPMPATCLLELRELNLASVEEVQLQMSVLYNRQEYKNGQMLLLRMAYSFFSRGFLAGCTWKVKRGQKPRLMQDGEGALKILYATVQLYDPSYTTAEFNEQMQNIVAAANAEERKLNSQPVHSLTKGQENA